MAETLDEFYRIKFGQSPADLRRDIGHVNVFRFDNYHGDSTAPVPYSRRDFYKISLICGHNRYHYADKSIEINGPVLMFFSPHIPYTWEPLSGSMSGYFCVFKKAFFTETNRDTLDQLPMFRAGGKPAYILDESQFDQTGLLFEKMISEINSDYPFKYDLIRNYIAELTHVGLKRQPVDALYQRTNAKARVTALFVELLERQFPIESPAQRMLLRSASDFASRLAIHVNYLNRAIRETTGKTTTAHIAERVVAEAQALLKHTDWSVTQISYCLGFDDPAHFTHFYRKRTGLSPSSVRKV